MTRKLLPSLALRSTRLRLLAWSYRDAFDSGTQDGGGAEKPGSRLLCHGDLWFKGSYDELEHAMRALDRFDRRVFRLEHVFSDRPFEAREARTLGLVLSLMPDSVFVPVAISEAAGFLPGDAKTYTMPRAEEARRRRGLSVRRAPYAVPHVGDARPKPGVRG